MNGQRPSTSHPRTPRHPPELVFYQTDDGRARLQVRLEDDALWLTQLQMAELFQTTKQNISLHVRNVLEDNELPSEATVKKYLTVQDEGGRQVERRIEHYHLDLIIAVGYRVRSPRGTQFRRWATRTLGESLVQGFGLDDERLKEGRGLGQDYFDELFRSRFESTAPLQPSRLGSTVPSRAPTESTAPSPPRTEDGGQRDDADFAAHPGCRTPVLGL
jgi:hypothetical protein